MNTSKMCFNSIFLPSKKVFIFSFNDTKNSDWCFYILSCYNCMFSYYNLGIKRLEDRLKQLTIKLLSPRTLINFLGKSQEKRW